MSLTYVPGSGPIGAKIMIVGDSPTPSDTNAGKAFGGTHGELFTVLRDAGIYKPNCWFTTVSKYNVPPRPKGKKVPFAVRAKNVGVNIEEQMMDLQKEINEIKPNVIITLGDDALWGVTGKKGIQDYRGSILQGMGRKVVPTYNPYHLSFRAEGSEFIGYWNRQIILFDLKRALLQSRFPEISLPQRNLQICQNSFQLAEFRNMYRNKIRMAADIEANGTCIPVCVGLSLNPNHGMTVPLWNTDGISNIPSADLAQMWLILAEMLWDKDIVGQNFNYDRDKLVRLGFIIRKLASDLMMKSFAINPELPKALAFNTSIYTEEPFYKNEGMYQGSTKDLLIGCARDACVTLEVDEAMDADLDEIGQREFFENFLMKLPDFYWGIERQGFRVNEETRDNLVRKYVEWDEKLNYELFKLTGTAINVNSPKQIQILLFENFKLPRKPSTGEEAITELLNSPTAIKKPEHRRVCELILEKRRVRKSIGTYLMALPDYDHRVRTTYFPCLETGRSSTGQQDPPIRPKIECLDENGKKKQRVLGTAFQTITKHGDIGQDIRGMYCADSHHLEWLNNELIEVEEEEVFVQADSSQAEARVVALLADDETTLAMYDEHDIHALTASWFFGGTESDYSKKVLGYEHPIRFAGKTLRHAGHLGAAKRRASIELNTQARKYKIPITITEALAGKALEIFHRKSPRIQGVFQAKVIEAIKKTRVLVAPLPYGVQAQAGGRRTFFERWGDELNRQAFSYIPQRAVSDNTKNAGMRIKQRIPLIKIVMEAHDALLFSIPISKVNAYVPIIKQEMERPIDFSVCTIKRHDLIIPCDIEIGPDYYSLKKFKGLSEIAPPTPKLNLPPKSITDQFRIPE